MAITSEQFADALNSSSLTKEERNGVLNLLEALSVSQIEELYEILKKDSKNMAKILERMESSMDLAVMKANMQMENIIKKGNEKK